MLTVEKNENITIYNPFYAESDVLSGEASGNSVDMGSRGTYPKMTLLLADVLVFLHVYGMIRFWWTMKTTPRAEHGNFS